MRARSKKLTAAPALVVPKVMRRRPPAAIRSSSVRTPGSEGPTGQPMRSSEVPARKSKLS